MSASAPRLPDMPAEAEPRDDAAIYAEAAKHNPAWAGRRIAWLETLLSIANQDIGALREKLAYAERTKKGA